MAFATRKEARLHFEAFGPADAPAVLLLAGTGRQTTDYDEEFCAALIARGFRPIRFDSRDVGRSTAFGASPANLSAVYEAALNGSAAHQAYTLKDMALDALAVLDAAGAAKAHLIGRSLGGAVAQLVAIEAPDRLSTLTLIMTNSRSIVSDITPESIARIENEELSGVEDYVGRQVRAARANALPQDFDETRIAGEARDAWARGVHAGAIARHFAVAIGMPDLRAALARLTMPTLVRHGARDRMIDPSYAWETAAAIPNAKLIVLEEMGHDGAPRVRRNWLPAILEHIESD